MQITEVKYATAAVFQRAGLRVCRPVSAFDEEMLHASVTKTGALTRKNVFVSLSL